MELQAHPSHSVCGDGVGSRLPLRFHGRGEEYFGIWIVNLLLSILTLGIYSAWAKVRRLKYFHGATELDGARGDYHADPVQILKGRLIGLGLFTAYNVAWDFSLIGGLLMLVLMIVMLPLLLRSSFRFHARNSSYRGLRFGFDGGVGQAYRVFLLGPVLALLTLGLAAPWAYRQVKAYQHGASRFGASPFSFHAPVSGYWRVFGVVLVALIVTPILMAAVFSWVGVGDIPADDSGARVEWLAVRVMVGLSVMAAVFFALGPYLAARLQNLNWSGTGIGSFRFESCLQARALLWVRLSNLVLIVATLGLFKPWADMREARLRVQSVSLGGDGDLDSYLRGALQDERALGEEAAEWFDLDIGF